MTEFKEASSGTISENRIFGNGYRLNKDGNLIASGEACKTNVTMRTSSRKQRDYHHGPNKVNRETRINCPSNTASTTLSSILATFANPGIKAFEMLSCQNTFRQGCKGRTFLLDRKLKALQWKVPDFASNRLVHINEHIYQGVGATCKGIRTGGPWPQEERKAHINLLELKVVHLAIMKTKFKVVDGQQSSFELPGKDGGHS